MFKKILIANRGEIACRIAATCKRMGIASVAVFSDADAGAKHVNACDEAVHIGGASAAESYLVIERIIEAAVRTGAQAVHPGYGFLSENEAFAEACEQAGLVFIGPPVAAIAAMGSKAAAKALMQTAAVPLVPGYHGDDQRPDVLRAEADNIGYPVLLKASAGGGGKGMRVVEKSADFPAALASCQREAASSFGSDRVLIEKYLLRSRHVEVQVFADHHGDAVYLFDRDCSVQRRHQKVLEEAPAPGLSAATRRAMGEAAVAAARAVRYVGAGTVEFIMVEDEQFYFMEMNTRLQVEHPVTEMITGQDLVAWQLQVADGARLPLRQEALRIHGHAIEARIYAEDPDRGFLPSTGRLTYLRLPEAVEFSLGRAGDLTRQGAGALHDGGPVEGGGDEGREGIQRGPLAIAQTVRIDAGVREGDSITPFYDPMIAKLIVHGRDRKDALAGLQRALRECQVVGPHTNVPFLSRIVAGEAFSQADLDTGLIERHHASLFPAPGLPSLEVLALACAAFLARREAAGYGASPWQNLPYWRMAAPYREVLTWRDVERDTTHEIVLMRDAGSGAGLASRPGIGQTHGVHAEAGVKSGFRLTLQGGEVSFSWGRYGGNETQETQGRYAGGDSHAYWVGVDGLQVHGHVVVEDGTYHVFHAGAKHVLAWHDPLSFVADHASGEGRLTAPMPGQIIAVLVEAGMTVEKGTPLLVMEAMKMEHAIAAPGAGVVSEIFFGVGDQVSDGAQLLAMEIAP
jgi:3-methylcrotonyl-CoA carboxylase alpha subunit